MNLFGFLKKKRAARKAVKVDTQAFHAKPEKLDYRLVHRLAVELEKAKLGDYVQMMAKPWRSIWLNFVAGVARGAGIVVGTVLVGGIVVIFTIQGLKYVAAHSEMVPWVGEQVKEAVGFILQAANEKLETIEEAP